MARIKIPNNWNPRSYQLPLWRYMEGGGKRAMAIWHRRSGKDDVCLHWTAASMIDRVGTYWHMLPEGEQCRKAIWEGVNPHTGLRRIDEAFPQELRTTTRENQMMIRFVNGSTWQALGSDNYQSFIGSPPVGIVYSEWAQSLPASWAYLRPILLENGGWTIFNGTPRGQNHAYEMFKAAQSDPTWFAELLTADDTNIFTPAQLETERQEFIREHGEDVGQALFIQEYYCSFSAAIIGAFYVREMAAADRDGRITFVPHDPKYPVDTAWDMGKGLHMAIICVQQIGMQCRIIDCVTGVSGVPEAVKMLRERSYNWGNHYMPHDAEPAQIGSGKSMKETAESLGLKPVIIVPQGSVGDGINAVRLLLPRCAFDNTKAASFVKAMKHYQREWDEVKNTFKTKPRADWAAHFADSMRTYAMGFRPSENKVDYHKLFG